jgi:hypothetical protein
MRQRREAARRFMLTLLAFAGVLLVAGAIIAGLAGRDTWRTMMWALVIGGGVLVVVNVAGSGSSRPLADPRSGLAFGSSVRDATTSASLLFVGLVLAGLGVTGLVL